MPRLGFRLGYRNFKNKVRNYFVNWNKQDTFNILLAIVAILLTLKGNKIADASYELSKSDTSQTAQISRLNTVAINQNTQLDTLVSILKEIRTQNNLTQASNRELISQGIKISKQSNDIGQQLGLARQERQAQRKNDTLQQKNNFIRLLKLFNDIEALLPWTGLKTLKQYDVTQRKNFYQQIRTLLEGETNNPLVRFNDTLAQKYDGIYFEIIYNLRIMDNWTTNNSSVLIEVNGKNQMSNDSTLIANTYMQAYGEFIDRFYDFFKFLRKVVKRNSQ